VSQHPVRLPHVVFPPATIRWWPRVGLILLAPALGLAAARAPTPSAVAAVSGCALLAIALWPRLGWYVLAVLATPVAMAQVGQSWATIALSVAALVTSLVWMMATPGSSGRLVISAPRATLALLGFMAFSLAWSTVVWPTSAAERSLEIAFVVICGPIVVALATIEDDAILRRVRACFVLGTVATALLSMITSIAASRALLSSVVVQSDSPNHNLLGLLYVLGVATVLTWDGPLNTLRRFALAAAMAILIVAILDSFSRSSILALGAVGVAHAYLRGIKPLVVGVAVVVAVMVLAPAVWAHLATGVSLVGSSQDPSSIVRLDLWSAASRMFADNPLLGVGFGGFVAALPHYWTGDVSGTGSLVDPANYLYAHNLLLTLLAMTGVVGAALAAVFVVVVARPALRGWASHDRAVLVLVGAAVGSAFGEPLLTPSALVAFLLLLKSPMNRAEVGSSRSRQSSV
jgi:hypothetical protein